MNLKVLVFCICFVVACLISHAHADPLPANRVANGAIDRTICGIDVIRGNFETASAELGKGKFINKSELTKQYKWKKDQLNIEIDFDNDENSIKFVRLSGSDPTGICKTGRGLQLGQSLEEVKSLYGQFYDKGYIENKTTQLTAVWSENEDLYINMWFPVNTQTLSKIEFQYMLE